MAKASGSLDLKSLKVAGEGASKYITAIDQNGIKVHAENNSNLNYTKINAEGMEVHQNVSNTDKMVASFTADGAQIGQNDVSHINMDYHSLQLKDREGNTYFYISDLRDADGYAEITESFPADASTTEFTVTYSVNSPSGYNPTVSIGGNLVDYTLSGKTFTISSAPVTAILVLITYKTLTPVKAYTIGSRQIASTLGGYSVAVGFEVTASGMNSYAEGNGTIASGFISHAEGAATRAIGDNSHAEGRFTRASGIESHAEGGSTQAVGDNSHAEGADTVANSHYSHAEGYNSSAGGSSSTSGMSSHAEGYQTKALGFASHSEGRSTRSSGSYSHASGFNTEATTKSQNVIGEYNILDTSGSSTTRGDYAFIIGNGTSNQRSNALTVDWSGNSEQQGRATTEDMTAQEVQDFVDGLDISGAGIETTQADWVVEQGTDGIWTWRKWQSGIAECWGRTPVTTYTCSIQSGNLWYTSDVFAFPTGLFVEVISGQSNRAPGTGSTPSNTLVSINGRTLSPTSFGIWVETPQSTSQSLSISLYAMGRWK